MPITYTPSGIALIGNGEEAGSWGSITNINLQILNQLTSEAGAIALSGTTHTLTVSDGGLSDGQYAVLVFGGAPSGTNTVTISPPDAKRVFIVRNNTAQSVVLTQGSGGNVTVASGRSAIVYCDGAGASALVFDVTALLVPVLANAGVTADASELNVLDGITASTAELNVLDGITASTAELNILDGVTADTAEINILDGVTADTAEINILDGVTASTAELNILDGVTASTAEINLLDGVTSIGFRNIPPVGTKTTSYTLQTADVGKYVQVGSGGSITVPDATFAEGDAVSIFNNTSGDITITCSITTAYIAGTDTDVASVTLATRGVANVLFISGTVAVLTGNIS
jgi:hypothetical protein